MEPDFNLTDWTTYAWTSEANSCYNYAVNSITSSYAAPGRSAGMEYSSLTPEEVRGAAVLDGMVDHKNIADGEFPVSNNCVSMLVMIPGSDFHFFRRDSDGNWSHKPGKYPPTNLDNSGNIITDPRVADIAPYKFVRFLSTCPIKMVVA